MQWPRCTHNCATLRGAYGCFIEPAQLSGRPISTQILSIWVSNVVRMIHTKYIAWYTMFRHPAYGASRIGSPNRHIVATIVGRVGVKSASFGAILSNHTRYQLDMVPRLNIDHVLWHCGGHCGRLTGSYRHGWLERHDKLKWWKTGQMGPHTH